MKLGYPLAGISIIILVLGFTYAISANTTDNIALNTDKTNYTLGETVNISLTAPDNTSASLYLLPPSGDVLFLLNNKTGSFSTLYTPREVGNYTTVCEVLNLSATLNADFTVTGPLPGGSGGNLTNVMDEEKAPAVNISETPFSNGSSREPANRTDVLTANRTIASNKTGYEPADNRDIPSNRIPEVAPSDASLFIENRTYAPGDEVVIQLYIPENLSPSLTLITPDGDALSLMLNETGVVWKRYTPREPGHYNVFYRIAKIGVDLKDAFTVINMTLPENASEKSNETGEEGVASNRTIPSNRTAPSYNITTSITIPNASNITIQTDKREYHPWEEAEIRLELLSNQSCQLEVITPSGEALVLISAHAGVFSAQYRPQEKGTYTVTCKPLNLSTRFTVLEPVFHVGSWQEARLTAGAGGQVAAKIHRISAGRLEVFPKSTPIKKIEFDSINLTQRFDLGLDEIPPGAVSEHDFIRVYAIDPSRLEFAYANVTVTATGTELYKCKDWDFTSQKCLGEWELFKRDLVPGQNYTFQLTKEDPGFGESITIIDIQSYPTVGGNWTVRFTTNGTANLTITAVNGTTWSDSDEDEDLRFLEVKCGEDVLSYDWVGNSIFIADYSCNETGYEVSRVLTSGKHTLEFRFGDQTKYAHNYAGYEGDNVTLIYATTFGQDVETPTPLNLSAEMRKDSGFTHSTTVNPERLYVNVAGWYKVSYGCHFTQQSTGTNHRLIVETWVENTGTEIVPSRTSCYIRDSESDRNRCSNKGTFIVSLNDGDYLELWANKTKGTGTNPATTESCYMYVQMVNNDVAQMYDADGEDDFHETNEITVSIDTTTFADSDFAADTDEYALNVTSGGWYKIYYHTCSHNYLTTNRNSVQTYIRRNGTKLEPSDVFSYLRNEDADGTPGDRNCEAGYLLYNLSAGDSIDMRHTKIGWETASQNSRTLPGQSWLLMEKINHSDVFMAYDEDIHTGTTMINLTTNYHVGSSYSHSDNASRIYINRDGWYEVSYTMGYNETTGSNNRNILCGGLYKNGVVYYPSWQCHYSKFQGGGQYATISANVIMNIMSGEYIELQFAPEEATGTTVRNATWVTIIPLDTQDLTPPTLNWDWADINSTTSYNSTTICVSLSETSNCTLHFNGTDYVNTTTGTHICWNQTNKPNGNYSSINATCEDAAGNGANTTTAWWNVSFNSLDTTPPKITWTWSDINSTSTTTRTTNVTLTVDETVPECNLTVNGTVYLMNYAGNNVWWQNLTNFANGNYTVWANCSDAAGNLGNSTIAWWNVSFFQAPRWSNNETNATTNVTHYGNTVYFNVTLSDDWEGNYSIFYFYNGTDWNSDPPQAWTTPQELQRIIQINATRGALIKWYWWFNDSHGISNQTDVWNFTVGNSPPTQGTPILNSSWDTNYTYENLTCYNQSTADADGDSVKNIYNWTVDGASIFLTLAPFEGGSNDTWTRDYSGALGYNLTASATWNKTGGYDGRGAYEFNGIDEYIDLDEDGASPVYDAAFNTRTVALWFKADSVAGATYRMLYEEGGSVNGMNIYIYDGRIYAGAWSEGDGWQGNWSSFPVTADEWHFAALIFDGPGGSVSLFYDGHLNTSNSYSTQVAGHSGDDGIGWMDGSSKGHLGDLSGGGNYFNGTIDEFMAFGRALSNEQLNATYWSRTNTIVAQETAVGETWQCSIIPNDLYDDGEGIASNTLLVLQDNKPPNLDWNWSDINSTINVTSTTVCVNASERVNCTLHFAGSTYTNTTKGTNICWTITGLSKGNYTPVNATCEDLGSNKANTTNAWVYVRPDMWHVFCGNVSGRLYLRNFSIMYNWTWDGDSKGDGNVYAYASGADIDWESLVALGRTTLGGPASDDFEEVDTVLGTASYVNDTNRTFSTDGSTPKNTTTFVVKTRTISNVPIVNSTDTWAFVTGILWDSSDTVGDNEFDALDNEDLVFVTKINVTASSSCSPGAKYEIRLPDTLDTYKGGSGRVNFQAEISL